MRCVVFDLDGTLADTSADLLAAANACLPAPMLGPEDALCAFHGGRAMLRLGYSRLGRDWSEADVDAAYPVLLEAYGQAIAVHTRLYPGAMEAVELLKSQGFAVSICTNKPEALAEELLRQLGVRGAFDAMIGADTLPVRKPDPAPYVAAVERAGGAVARSMLVGDTETDAKTGLAAGVPVALVTFGPEGAGVCRFQPAALLDRYDDLPDLAARLLR
ncbi:HAD-IA family hydrolase [Tabrizicola sp.]|uniref:HAD-IA family hydrolase n=1 Tax=Tabrizicola sp. TaxID=2005166 RepID=UPI002615F919|nr:HAD-IA family hydrolase [Tabrizicola sp.]MDM7930285.1 HAD-IA family hydrolase [Tabrizicola sp.]